MDTLITAISNLHLRFCLTFFFAFCLGIGLLGCDSNSNAIGPAPNPNPTEPPIPDHSTGDLVVNLPNEAKMAFILIESGTFVMGAETSEDGYKSDESPQHQVTLTKNFYFGKYEVTQAQWKSVMGTEPWKTEFPWGADTNAIGDDFPAVTVTWFEIQEFLDRLNALDKSSTYRLPTESEWEYACRAGTTTAWSFGEVVGDIQPQNYQWYQTNSNDYAHKVGLKEPNPWGLYDMHGNVAELVDYWEIGYTNDPQIDPPTAKLPDPVEYDSGIYYYPMLFLRGGAVDSKIGETRSASRSYAGRAGGLVYNQGVPRVGFRVVRNK